MRRRCHVTRPGRPSLDMGQLLLQRRPLTGMTRVAVCRILGVTRNAVTHYMRTGRLHTTIDARGVHRFDRAEVEALAQTRRLRRLQPISGEVAADAFQLFNAGYSPAEVVIELAQQTEIIRALWEEYKSLECQRPSSNKGRNQTHKRASERPAGLRALPRSPLKLLTNAPPPPAPSNVSQWSRDFDEQQEKKRRLRMGNRP
jgi:hypothetical protein